MTAVVVTTVIVAGATAYLSPPNYRAAATVMIDAGSIDLVSQVYNPMMSNDRFQLQHAINQLSLLMSERVSRKVTIDFKMAQNPEVREMWMEDTKGVGDLESWYGNRLRAGVSVDLPDGMAMLKVRFDAWDPDVAAQFANAYVKALMDTNAEMRQENETRRLKHLADHIDALRVDLRKAWHGFLMAKSSIPHADSYEPGQEDGIRLHWLSRSQLLAQRDAAWSRHSSIEIAREVENTPDLTNSYPVAGSLVDRLVAEETSLAQMREQLGDSHPLVIAAKSRIAEFRARFTRELQQIKAQENLDASATALKSSSLRATMDQTKADALGGLSATAQIRAWAEKINAVDTRYTQAYLAYQENLNLRAYQLPRLSVVNWALAPNEPMGLPLYATILLSVLLGIFLAFGYVMIAELLDGRVYSREDLQAKFAIPVFNLPRRVNG